jgi:hypothetical protein
MQVVSKSSQQSTLRLQSRIHVTVCVCTPVALASTKNLSWGHPAFNRSSHGAKPESNWLRCGRALKFLLWLQIYYLGSPFTHSAFRERDRERVSIISKDSKLDGAHSSLKIWEKLTKFESETLTGRNCVRGPGVDDKTRFNRSKRIAALKCEFGSAGLLWVR